MQLRCLRHPSRYRVIEAGSFSDRLYRRQGPHLRVFLAMQERILSAISYSFVFIILGYSDTLLRLSQHTLPRYVISVQAWLRQPRMC
jgi:hypothetical protein